MPPTENKTISYLTNIFSLDQIIIFFVAVIIIILVIIGVAAKKLKIRKITLGPFEAEIEKEKKNIVPVYRIAILRHPTSVSGNPALLNQLVVRVYDRDNNPLQNKRVTITLEGKESNSEFYISGSLSEISDDKGEAVFSGLTILRRGSFSIIFHADGATAKAKSFNVTPPGLDIDFESKKPGSAEYTDTLRFAISLNKANDRVIMNGEEIN